MKKKGAEIEKSGTSRIKQHLWQFQLIQGAELKLRKVQGPEHKHGAELHTREKKRIPKKLREVDTEGLSAQL